MKTQPTLIASSTGEMVPIELPVDWSLHNRGITPSFFERREPKVDEAGKAILDATGKADEHILEFLPDYDSGRWLHGGRCPGR